jgi:hypothetical protein
MVFYEESPARGHSGGIATCKNLAKCILCQQEYGELDPTKHISTSSGIHNAVASTCEKDGYEGDLLYCNDCETTLIEGAIIKATGHSMLAVYGENRIEEYCINNCGYVIYHDINVTSVTFDKSALELRYGETEILTAKVSPYNATNQAVIWTTSDPSIAEVTESGEITATGIGTAIITATSVDGGYVATCTVTVVEPPPLTVKALMGVGYYMTSSSSVRAVYVEASPSGGSENYVEYYIKVYFNGVLVAEGAKNEIFVTVANGTYTAEVYVKDSNGNEATNTSLMTLSGY